MSSFFFSLISFLTAFVVILLILIIFSKGSRKDRAQVKQRLDRIMHHHEQASAISLKRQQYLETLSPMEQSLESLPGMASLRKLIEQTGKNRAAYQVAALCLILMLVSLLSVGIITGYWLLALPISLLLAWLPILHLTKIRNDQLTLFEEQLPDALDAITRSLQVGHPFNDAMRMVSIEMKDPIASEFGMTSMEINYGVDFKSAMINLLERKPSISLMALVSSVLIQRETGGNLSEVLSNLSEVIRSRFQLQRKVKTLSAEGRLSALILLLLPFVLMGVIYFANPDYLYPLFYEPFGQKLLTISGVSMILGVIWIKKIIKITY